MRKGRFIPYGFEHNALSQKRFEEFLATVNYVLCVSVFFRKKKQKDGQALWNGEPLYPNS